MKIYIVIIISFLFHTALAFCQSKDEKIDQLMNAYYKNGVFNGAILVSHQGKVIYKKAFGIADREWSIPITTNTKFKIASLSK